MQKNGCPLMNPNSIDTLIKVVLPYADLLTHNILEAEKISNIKISSTEDMKTAAKLIYDIGCKNVLVKGGHAIGDARDVLYDGKEFYYFETKRINTKILMGQVVLSLRLLLPILH